MQVGSRRSVTSEGDPYAPPRDSGIRANVHRDQDQGKRVFPQTDRWKDVLEKFWNRKAAGGGNLVDWWNVRLEGER